VRVAGRHPRAVADWARSSAGLAPLAAAGLTLIALALRLAGLGQTLFGDEILTYRIVTDRGLSDVLDHVAHGTDLGGELNPPLYYALTWLAVQAGDPSVSIRLPSLILGTLTVPLVYVLGRRTVGTRAALVGAAVVTAAPFAIFYSVEARGYATVSFFSALSTVALLSALRRGGPLPWLGYGASTAALLYTSYTAIFVMIAQLGWALWAHRDRARPLALVHGGVALVFAPWVPSFLDQLDQSSEQAAWFAKWDPLSVRAVWLMTAHTLPGYPPVSLGRLPGIAAVVVVWGTLTAAIAAALMRLARHDRGRDSSRPPGLPALIVLLALAAPLGLVLYSLQPEKSLLVPRYLSASFPAMCLAVGWLLASLRPRFAAVAVVALLTALGIGTVGTLDVDLRRPPYREVAEFINREGRDGDPVLNFSSTFLVVSADLGIYLDGRHHVIREGQETSAAWARAVKGQSVFLVQSQDDSGRLPRVATDRQVALQESRYYRGNPGLAVGRYAGKVTATLETAAGREVIRWSASEELPVRPGTVRGFVDDVARTGRRLSVSGWAADLESQRTADLVLAFVGRHVVGIGVPRLPRPDIADAYGKSYLRSGYSLRVAASRGLRVFAVSGEVASELKAGEPER
jgi:hypothetical protein